MRFALALQIALALAVAAPTTAAEPTQHGNGCIVAIMHAPDDVRAVIEAWVDAEPRCDTILEVRVVPTDGGLYLFARGLDGSVRERVVPDAQAAGVLVASWAADERLSHSMVEPSAASGAPGTIIAAEGTPRIVQTATVDQTPAKWMTLGGTMMIGGSGARGARLDLDLVTRGSWSFGIGASGSQTNDDVEGSGWLKLVDLKLVGAIARSAQFGAWQIRPAAGAGVVYTRMRGSVTDYSAPKQDWMEVSSGGAWLTAEASLLISRRLGDWGLGAGPLVTWMSQRTVNGEPGQFDRTLALTVVAGLRYRM